MKSTLELIAERLGTLPRLVAQKPRYFYARDVHVGYLPKPKQIRWARVDGWTGGTRSRAGFTVITERWLAIDENNHPRAKVESCRDGQWRGAGKLWNRKVHAMKEEERVLMRRWPDECPDCGEVMTKTSGSALECPLCHKTRIL